MVSTQRRASIIQWPALMAFVFILTGGPGFARAGDALRKEIAELAKRIAEIVQSESADAVAVGEFTGPRRMRSSSGPGIAQLLCHELQKISVSVKDSASLEVKGDFLDVEDAKTERLAALLKLRVLDRAGKTVFEGERNIFSESALAELFGLTAQLPPNAGDEARKQRLKESLDRPRTNLKRSRMGSAVNSPYTLEVLLKTGEEYSPLEPKVENGRAFVSIPRDAVYALRLNNDSEQSAAVVITIDGINVFAFSDLKNPATGEPKYRYFVTPPRATSVIPGWFRTNEKSDSFLVSEYAKSAAAELLHSSADCGTITVTFAAAWPKDEEPPPDEPPVRSADATARGPEVTTEYKEVQRTVGVIRSIVSVRYSK